MYQYLRRASLSSSRSIRTYFLRDPIIRAIFQQPTAPSTARIEKMSSSIETIDSDSNNNSSNNDRNVISRKDTTTNILTNDECEFDKNQSKNSSNTDTCIDEVTTALQKSTLHVSDDDVNRATTNQQPKINDKKKEKEEKQSQQQHQKEQQKQEQKHHQLIQSIWANTEASYELKQFAEWILDGTCRNIMVVTGAGISVNAGIPDFRTPGTGLYDNLQAYKLPYPEAIFELSFYAKTPEPFISLASALWPGQCTGPIPTMTHVFLQLLHQHDRLLRTYTQNIDGLEYLASVPDPKIVECHGHFRSASCISCHRSAPDMDHVKRTILQQNTVPLCPYCHKDNDSNTKSDNKTTPPTKKTNYTQNNNRPGVGYIKPDIVFFGESLPERFYQLIQQDISVADCCLVLGTSLQVAPVSNIPEMVKKHVKRILINREYVGHFNVPNKYSKSKQPSKQNNTTTAQRDLFHPGDCDASIVQLCELLGWKDELLRQHALITESIRNKNNNGPRTK